MLLVHDPDLKLFKRSLVGQVINILTKLLIRPTRLDGAVRLALRLAVITTLATQHFHIIIDILITEEKLWDKLPLRKK